MAIVGDEFCKHHQELRLVYTESCWGSQRVKDSNDNLVFKLKHPTFGKATVLIKNASSHTVLRLCQKNWKLRTTWEVFPGRKSSSMLFLVRDPSLLQFNLSLDVFVGPNPDPKKDHPDYTVRKKAWGGSIKVLRGQSVVAKYKARSSCSCSGGGSITVNPGTDSAFALALFLIVIEIDKAGQEMVDQALQTVQ